MITTDTAELFFALLTLVANAAVLGGVGLWIAARWSKGAALALDDVRIELTRFGVPLAFAVAATAMLGSLYFSEVAHFTPCRLCWYQRICMYPLTIVTLLAALANDRMVCRYVLPLPLVGACVSVYHILVENNVVEQARACLISAPGGCATKWIDEFGYVTIPTLALTGFALCFAFLLLGALPPPSATVREQ